MDKLIIGRKDKIDIPAFHLENVSVKIDSGAYSCSIHCTLIEEINQNGQRKLAVVFLDPSLPKFTGNTYLFDSYYKKNVKSSTGQTQERFFISCEISLFGQKVLTDFSLTTRSGLKNPILIGRKVLNNRFLIDTALVNQSYKQKIKAKRS